ncbi:deoxyribonuclease V [bacterium]|nr:deoxyribonuclease V [bacterium]
MHSWENLTLADAKSIQNNLARDIIVDGVSKNVNYIAAGDLAFSKDSTAFGAVVLMTYPEFEIVELHTGKERVRFPYIPGYLTFREAPLLLSLFEKLQIVPDLVMVDGQGIAHPRKMGLGAHIGLFLGIPTIGVAKSRLIGKYDEPKIEKGSWSWLTHKSEKIGMVVRTRKNVKPLFISPGNLIGFESALNWTLKCSIKYRIPEPTKIAHNTVTNFKKSQI